MTTDFKKYGLYLKYMKVILGITEITNMGRILLVRGTWFGFKQEGHRKSQENQNDFHTSQ